MKKIVLITSAILLTLCIIIACDNGVAFVNDVKPVPSADSGLYVPIYVTALDAEKFEGDTDPELKYTFSPNPLPDGLSFSGVLSREPGEIEGGSPYAITQGTLKLEGTGADMHIMIFTGAKFKIFQKGSISIRAKNMSKFKDEDDPLFDESTYVVSPSIESLARQGLTLNVILSRDPGEDTGGYAIHVNYTLTGEHASEWVVNRVGATFYITADDEIIVTAPSLEKNYKDVDPVFHVSTTPALPDGLTLVGGPGRDKEGELEGEVVGNYRINQGSLAFHPAEPDDAEGHKTGKASNNKVYKLIFQEGNLKINKRPVAVTAESYVVLKNDPMPDTFDYRNNENLPATAFTGTLKCVAADTKTTGEFQINQGSLALTDTWIDVNHHEKGTYKQNYDITFVPSVLNVTNNIPIEVYANAQTQVFGEDEKYLSYSYTPALPAGLSLAGDLARSGSNNVGTYAISRGDLHFEGAEANLYVLHFHGADYKIVPKVITVSATARNKLFGDADPDLTFSTKPYVVTSEAFTGSLIRDEGETAGTYSIKMRADNDPGKLKLAGQYAKNYSFNPSTGFEGETFTINPSPVTVTIYHTSKVRDDDDPEFDYAVTPSELMGIPNWKTTVFKGNLERDKAGTEDGEKEGSYEIKQGTLALKGEYASNYFIKETKTATLRITPPGPVHISDPVTYMKPIITNLHDTYAKLAKDRADGKPATFRKADGPLKRNPSTGEYPDNIKGETFLGSFTYWYDENDNTVYYYYGGPVYLYGDCHNLFEGCYKYETMDMTGFNTQYVTNMYQMFFLCYNVKKLDLAGWSFNNVSTMANMFDRCEKLEEIYFNDDGVDMSHVTHMGWIFAHNFYMTPTKLRAIIGKWKVKIDPNGGNDDSNINSLFLSNATTGSERDPAGANRIISNDMGTNGGKHNKIPSSEIKKYIKDRVIPDSNGYAGDPPSLAFETDFGAYETADGVLLYLGNPGTVQGQRLNLIPAGSR